MAYTAKRFAAFLMACTWAILSIIVPVTAHAAIYNAASKLTGNQWYIPATGTGIAGNAVVATAATMLARANPWVAAITLGTPVMRWLLEKKTGGNVEVAPRDIKQEIPGWVNGSPPSTTPATSGYTATINGSNYVNTTALGACQAAAANPTASCGGETCLNVFANTGGGNCRGYNSGGSVFIFSSLYGPDLVCPAGYTLSGSNCNLTNESLVMWPSDGKATYVPTASGTTLEKHPRDPDPLPASPTIAEILNPSKDYAPDVFGNPTSTTITPSANGFSIEQRVQTTKDNQTATTINNVTINNAGQVTNVSSTTVPGEIALASPTAIPVSSGGTIQFPTDYNREATQQQAVQKLEDIKQGTGAADAPNYQQDTNDKKSAMNQEIKDKAEAIPGQYAGDKASWFSWVWTPPVGNCAPWNSTIHGQSVSWDICPYINKVRDVIGYLLAIATTWGVYLQLFKRED